MQQCDASLLFSSLAEQNPLYLCLRIARWKGSMASRCGKSRSSLRPARILQADLSPSQPFLNTGYSAYIRATENMLVTRYIHPPSIEQNQTLKLISDLKFSLRRYFISLSPDTLEKMADAVTVFAAIETVLTITQVGSHYFLFTELNAFYSSRTMSCVTYTFTQKEYLYCRLYNLSSRN